MTSTDFINDTISVVSSFVAIFIALWIERMRQPSLKITVSEDANHEGTYPKVGRVKFFRANITNMKFPIPFSWIPKYSASNCSAELLFTRVDSSNQKFSMKGRWAGTPELGYLPPEQYYLRILFPEPISISPGGSEILDVIIKHDKDHDAYGWNNEAYFNNWKTPKFKLTKGEYNIEISVITQNGTKNTRKLKCNIADTIENTRLYI